MVNKVDDYPYHKVKGQFVYFSPHKGIRVEPTGKNLTTFGVIQLVRGFLNGMSWITKDESTNR